MNDDEGEAWAFWRRDRSVEAKGGLIDPGYLDEFHRMGCGWVRQTTRDLVAAQADEAHASELTNLSLFFIDSGATNALALECGDRKGVAIYTGLVQDLWSTLYRALGLGALLASWFDEAPPLPEPVSDAHVFGDPIWRKRTGSAWSRSRINVHAQLFDQAVRFVVAHELAHHARGHLSYLRREFDLSEIDEVMNLAPEDQRLLAVLRNVEYDADFHALDLLMEDLHRDPSFANWPEARVANEHLVLSIAIIVLFQRLDAAHRAMVEHYEQSHPAPVHRAMRATRTLSDFFAGQFGWSREREEEEHDLAWIAAAEVAEHQGMPSGRWHGDSTLDMDRDQLIEQEESSFAFSRMLDELNNDSRS